MANNKNVIKDEIITENQAKEKSAPANTEELVDFTAPYVPGHLEDDVRIVRNGLAITVKRGETVKIPAGYKAIYDRSQSMLKAAQKKAEQKQKEFMNAGK